MLKTKFCSLVSCLALLVKFYDQPITYDIASDTISRLSILDVVAPLTHAYRNPQTANGMVIFTSGTTRNFAFIFWNSRMPSKKPTVYRSDAPLVENSSQFLTSSIKIGSQIFYAPYFTKQTTLTTKLVWTILDISSIHLSQTSHSAPIEFQGDSPMSIVLNCKNQVACLVPDVTPPWLCRMDIKTSATTSLPLDVPSNICLPTNSKTIVTKNNLIVVGGTWLTKNNGSVSDPGVILYFDALRQVLEESTKQNDSMVPTSSDKSIYLGSRGVVSVVTGASSVKILPEDNGEGCGCKTRSLIESYASQIENSTE